MKKSNIILSTARCLTVAIFAIIALMSRADNVEKMLEEKYSSACKLTEFHTGTAWYSIKDCEGNNEGAADFNGRVIIPAKYKNVSLCGEKDHNMLWWEVEGHSGKRALFDYSGKQLIPFAFDNVDIRYGYGDKKLPYIEVTENGKVGTFDMKGNRIIPSLYDYISYENKKDNGEFFYYWEVRNGDLEGIYSNTGKLIAPCKYNYVTATFDEDYGKWIYEVSTTDEKSGIYDLDGKVLVNPEYESCYFSREGKNLIILTKKDGKFGALKPDGTPLVPNKYDTIAQVWNQYDPSSHVKEQEETPVQLAIKAKHPGAYVGSPDSHGNYWVSRADGGKSYYGLYNADGQPLLDLDDRYCLLYDINLPDGGSVIFAKTDKPNSARLYDHRGNPLTKEGYEFIELNNSQPDVLSYYRICRKGDGLTEGVMGLDGSIIVPCEFTGVSLIQDSDTKEYIFRVMRPDDKYSTRYGAYTINGDFLADAVYPDFQSALKAAHTGDAVLEYLKRKYPEVKRIEGSSEKLMAFEVKNGAFYGIADRNGKLIAPCEYSAVKMIADNPENPKHVAYSVTQNGKEGVIDLKGNLIIPCKYSPTLGITIDKGGFCVYGDGGFGYCNVRGEEILPPKYALVAYVPADESGPDYILAAGKEGVGAFTPSGSQIVPPLFNDVYNLERTPFGGYNFLARSGSNYGLYSWSGRMIMPCKYSEIYQGTLPDGSGIYYVGETSSGQREAFTSTGEPMAMPQRPQVAQPQEQGTDWTDIALQVAQLTKDCLNIIQNSQGRPGTRPGTVAPTPQRPSAGYSSGNTSGSTSSRRPTSGADVQNRANLQRTYNGYASRLSSMNYGTYPYSHGYTMQEVREAQSTMRSIRTEWNSKHPDLPIYEDSRAENWNGIKGSM